MYFSTGFVLFCLVLWCSWKRRASALVCLVCCPQIVRGMLTENCLRLSHTDCHSSATSSFLHVFPRVSNDRYRLDHSAAVWFGCEHCTLWLTTGGPSSPTLVAKRDERTTSNQSSAMRTLAESDSRSRSRCRTVVEHRLSARKAQNNKRRPSEYRSISV
jgi:hypothetical protein